MDRPRLLTLSWRKCVHPVGWHHCFAFSRYVRLAVVHARALWMETRSQAISLNDVVDADKIEEMDLLDDPETQRILLPLLPEGRQTVEELRETVREREGEGGRDICILRMPVNMFCSFVENLVHDVNIEWLT